MLQPCENADQFIGIKSEPNEEQGDHKFSLLFQQVSSLSIAIFSLLISLSIQY